MRKYWAILLMLSSCVEPSYAGEIKGGMSHEQGVLTTNSYFIEMADQVDYIDLSAYYGYGKTDDTVTHDEGRLSIGYDPVINDSWSLWMDETVGYREDIKFENFFGAGPKYKFNDKTSLSFGVLYYFKDSMEKGEGLYSFRLKTEARGLVLTAFYQPYMLGAGHILKGSASYALGKYFEYFFKGEYRSREDYQKTIQGLQFIVRYGDETN
jgi:hypothetical protein